MSPNGSIYVLARSALYFAPLVRVDPVTGDRTPIALTGVADWLAGYDLTALDDGHLLAIASEDGLSLEPSLYEIDLATATSKELARGLIAAVAVVPEPRAAARAAVATAVIVLLRALTSASSHRPSRPRSSARRPFDRSPAP